jgi:RNA polymerase sigma factor (sigma-70 family)
VACVGSNAGDPESHEHAAWSRRIAAGDEAAFAAFYAAWFAPTLALARAACRRDEGFCLDVVQDVMMTVANKMPALATGAAVGAWMSRTVRRSAIDRLRSEARRHRRELDSREGAPGLPTEPWHELAGHEQRVWLQACLDELPVGDQALLAARFGGAMSVTDAGAELGLSADAAHGRLRRVLERLRRRAAEWWHG